MKQHIVFRLADRALIGNAFTWYMRRRVQAIDAKFAMNFRGPLWYRECQEVFAVINNVSVLTEVAFKFNDGVHENDRLTFDYDFVSTFFAGVVLTLVAASST